MIELFALNYLNAPKSDSDNKNNKNDVSKDIATIVVFILYVTIFVWAIMRAIRCSNATPDSRALHLLFATASPVMYLVFSYLVEGFCPK